MNPDDPNATTSRVLTTFLPLMIGFFSLNVPSGLSLYYFSNTALMMLVMVSVGKCEHACSSGLKLLSVCLQVPAVIIVALYALAPVHTSPHFTTAGGPHTPLSISPYPCCPPPPADIPQEAGGR